MGPVAYFSLCLLGCLIFNPSLAGAQDMPCPVGWLLFQGNCYGYFPQEITWIEAEAECLQNKHRAQLASINSAEENNALAQYVRPKHTQNAPIWLGLLLSKHNQMWTWTDKSPFSFSAWERGQPNSPRVDEPCVGSQRPEFLKWHDYPCDYRHAFVCKRKPYGRQNLDGLPAPGL